VAKKRQQKIINKEEREFEFPEFDKEEFMKNEMRGAKTTMIGAGFGVAMAFVSYGIAFASPGVAFLVGLISMAMLKFVFESLNIDLTDFGWKGWAGSGAVYFFTWLMVWILISNPPISDLAPPELHGSGVFLENGNATMVFNQSYNEIGAPVVTLIANTMARVSIVAVATDNDELSSVKITIIHNDTTTLVADQQMRKGEPENYNIVDEELEDVLIVKGEYFREDNFFEYHLGQEDLPLGNYNFIITAKDEGGKSAKSEGSFTIR